jgi:hypothetical protein
MMNKIRRFWISAFAVVTLFAYNNCSKGGFEVLNASSINVMYVGQSNPLQIIGTETNVMPVKVGCGYINEPCVSVTICTPGTETCQTIPNILLDTGSYGLRVFSSLVTIGLTSTTIGAGTLAQCVSYADGTSDWGPVKTADVVLGKERASSVPIQLIDSAFGGIPSDCTRPDTSPSNVGFNGILGVGLFVEDCGAGCTTIANNRIYFSCSGSSCTPSTVPLAKQVANPVAFLPLNNNGTVLQLPPVPDSGAASLSGYLVLGIGTQKNNTPVDAHFLQADKLARINTDFNGRSYSSFIDSGSNGLFFPATPAITTCDASSGVSGFYCPSSNTHLTAVQSGAAGGAHFAIDFQVMSAAVALDASNPNMVFNNLAGGFDDAFDWGLPFFMGRAVFNGIEGKKSSLGTGPYWAY